MCKRVISLSSVFVLILCLGIIGFGQETTGSIEINVKDTTGAVVPNASVTVESSRTANSSTTGFRRTATTDGEGFQRILQVPPGTYRVTIAPTSGFAERIVNNIDVVLGKATPVNIELGVSTNVTVDVTGDSESSIDTTDTKIQTNISQKDAELLPKGTNFGSLLKISPATRPEPLSGGFQIDGSSGSENTFIIDGNERTNAFSGELDGNSNLPFQLVQEIQVKSSGFEAEYGGATGGVINVVTRGGSNDFRGEFGFQLRAPKLQPQARPVLDFSGNVVRQLPFDNDSNLGFFPTATLGGPIIKDRVWFFGSYTPQIFTRNRTITYRNSVTGLPNSLGSARYNTKQTNEYAFARIDAQPINNIRLTGTFTYNPIVVEGEIPGLATQFSALPNASANTDLATQYQSQLGGRQNAKSATGSIVWTPTGNLVLSLRGGHNFLNTKLGTYGRPLASSVTRLVCSATSINIPTNAGCAAGQSNGIAVFDATLFDATKRNTIDADATYITNLFGRHEFKGGYQYNGLSNDVLSERVNAITLRYGRTINQLSGRGNIVPSGPLCANPNAPTPGCVLGAGVLQRIGTAGSVSSKNEGIFVQDKYQPINRLTINIGVRAEKENVPSFNPDAPDLQFNFGSKIAPRIGVAYDLTGDGKTKISGFFGRFYDRFKYELPRGSFGGALFYQDFFEILPGDPAAFQLPLTTITGGSVVNSALGSCPNTGTVYGRIRCSVNARVPANAGLPIEIAGGLDPDIKPYRQSEMTITFERELSSKFVFQSRYTRKRLDRTIEDVGFINSEGSEVYIIGNPGEGISEEQRRLAGFRADRAIRRYDALEFRLDRRFADNYYFNANYTYSRLYGNYSGLASSDEAAILGGEGRTDPNVSRYFDAPFTEAVIAGGETRGRLATDRPHVFKIAAAYSLDWNKRFGFGSENTTEFQGFFTAQSGTPQTTIASIAGYNTIIVNGRGDLGRTEKFTSTDFAIRHRYRFGRDNRFTLVGEVDILNLFNENNVLATYNIRAIDNFALDDINSGLVTQNEIDTLSSEALLILAQRRFQANGAPTLLNAINSPAQLDPRFGQPLLTQAPREIRFGFRLLF
jgi:Carboxypeptidase regulatory-like domain/TonB-dependent Receptor Plug Domain